MTCDASSPFSTILAWRDLKFLRKPVLILIKEIRSTFEAWGFTVLYAICLGVGLVVAFPPPPSLDS